MRLSSMFSARARLGLICSLVSSACSTPTEPGCTTASSPSVVGTWRYTATQSSPTQAVLSGRLAITAQSCASFEGTLDVVQTDPQGQSHQLAGPVSGQVLDAGSLRFDAFLVAGEGAREHIGAIQGDTVNGTWLIADTGGGAVTGSFTAGRGSP